MRNSIEQLESRSLLAVVSWDGGAGTSNWEDALNWSGDQLPGPADDVQILVGPSIEHATGSTVAIHSLSSAASISFSGGSLSLETESFVSDNFTLASGATLTGPGDFFVAARFIWSGGTMSGSGSTRLLPGSRLEIRGETTKVLDGRTVINQDLVSWNSTGAVTFSGGASWLSDAGATWEMLSEVRLLQGSGTASSFINYGVMSIAGDHSLTAEVLFNNAGTLDIALGCALTAAAAASPAYVQSAGSTNVNGTLNAPAEIRLDGGVLSGAGLVHGTVTNHAVVRPGSEIGTLSIDGNYKQTADGLLEIQIGGSSSGQFDRLQVTGSMQLAGALNVTMAEGYSANIGELFPIIASATRSGGFTVTRLPDLGDEARLVVDNSSGLQSVLRVVSTADATGPVASLLGPSPNPHAGPIDTLAITFSEPIVGFDLSDLSLMRTGGGNLLPGPANLSSTDGITWTLNGLSSLTSSAGSYTLALAAGASNIMDLAGNPLAPVQSSEFVIAATVVGRWLFYNQSRFDGNNVAAGIADDGAIATDKVALLPGGTSTFANYSSYNRGLNGIMVDISNLPQGPLSASDFSFKVGNTTTPGDWTPLTTAPLVSARALPGGTGPSRVMLTWPSGAAIKQWLQVTVKANSNTGLTQPDVFYFGSALGETGNVAGDYSVSITDELLARNNPAGISPGTLVTNRFDFNRDGTVSVVDQLLVRNNITTNASRLKQITVPAFLNDEGPIPLALGAFAEVGQEPMAPTVAESRSRVAYLRDERSKAGSLMQTKSGQVIREEFSQTVPVGRQVAVHVSDDLLELIATSQRRG